MPWFALLTLGAAAAGQIDPATLIWQKSSTLAEVEAQAAQLHAAMDLDHDGFVTRDELLKGANRRVGHPPAAGDPTTPVPPLIQALFDEGDLDHDGRISAAESKADADREFARDDTDHDGVVTPDERLAGMKQFAARHPDAAKRTYPWLAAKR